MKPTVYIARDAEGRALYVGASIHPLLRLAKHLYRDWWGNVASFDLEHFESRDEARARERELIGALHPAHNAHLVPVIGGEVIREARLRAGKSQRWLAIHADLTEKTIRDIERGHVCARPSSVIALVDALGIDPDAFEQRVA